MKTIFCLFSVDNNHDQPRNNLVMWWSEKPIFEVFCAVFSVRIEDNINILTLLDKYGTALMTIKDVYNGKECRIYGDTHYRLEEVREATELEKE